MGKSRINGNDILGEKNKKIWYSKKEVMVMKLTKKGYIPRLIDKAIEENLEIFG